MTSTKRLTLESLNNEVVPCDTQQTIGAHGMDNTAPLLFLPRSMLLPSMSRQRNHNNNKKDNDNTYAGAAAEFWFHPATHAQIRHGPS